MKSFLRDQAKKAGLLKVKYGLNAYKDDIVFIWVPKNGGSTIFHMLKKYNCLELKSLDAAKAKFPNKGLVTFQHLPYHDLIKMGIVKESFDKGSVKFAVKRNPYDRAVSLFQYIKKIRELDSYTLPEFCSDLKNDKIEAILNIYTGIIPIHQPQISWLLDPNGELFVDHLINMDNFQTDLHGVFKKLNFDLDDIPLINSSKKKKPQNFYTNEEEIETIYNFYQKDFEVLGFSTELPAKYKS